MLATITMQVAAMIFLLTRVEWTHRLVVDYLHAVLS